jgi:muramoyltetrapeptide carboxypeptidase
VTTPQIGIAVVAPGGYAPDSAAVERGISRLQAKGIAVHNYYDHARLYQRFGATDDERLAQLHAAARDPGVQVVVALRGQYGMTRLLDRIDYDLLAASGKIFVGFSDMTALHLALLARTGSTNSYAGPMFAGDFGALEPVDFTLDNFWQCLAGPTHAIAWQAADNPEAEVSGTVWGGNLAMLVSVLGTEYFPRVDGGILFVEDINEHPYRIERMLLQLQQAGVLGRQRALVLGDVSGYRLNPADNGYDFEAMLSYLRAVLPIPVLTGLPFGHIPRRVTIPFGAQARLVSGSEGLRLTVSDYPTVRRG